LSTEFIHGLDKFPAAEAARAAVTVGTFDGIHRGHQAIFERLSQVSSDKNLDHVLVTFHPHPRMVVTPDDVPMLLTTIEEKEKFVPCFFEGRVLVLEFNQALRNMTAEQFVKRILVEKVGVKHLVVGYDHGLGKDRSGNPQKLEELGGQYGFETEVVPPVICRDAPISSSRIRQALIHGRYDFAVEMLGHDYAIYGKVERGIGLGVKLGYPTANVRYSHRKLLPPEGVYACWALVDKERHNGMMFVGQNHFNPEAKLSVEANLFDFDRDIYNHEIIVYPTRYIRENRRFESEEALVAQIEKDRERVLSIMSEGEKQCQ
jgi:riboflavin kinase/FMN adenylyltransferase